MKFFKFQVYFIIFVVHFYTMQGKDSVIDETATVTGLNNRP